MEEKKKGGTNWIANPKLSTVIEEKKKTETPNAMQRAWIQKKKKTGNNYSATDVSNAATAT